MVCLEVVLTIECQGLDMVGRGLIWCVVGGLIWGVRFGRGLDIGGLIWEA